MAIVKSVAIHTRPKDSIKYILRGDKNSNMKYASGINTIADVDLSYNMYKHLFEMCSDESFDNYDIDNTVKQNVRLHHYVQSFSPKENVDAELAHKIGLEWAKKTFGNDYQILCSTHIDKGHIHNHFLVSAYSNSGAKWYANYTSLTRARKISDSLCKSYDLGVIENPNIHGGVKYKEWVENRKKNSWKTNLRIELDKRVVNEKITSLDDLVISLQTDGYKIRQGKYITIQPPGIDRGVRTFRLGVGYSERDLAYRIKNKDREYSVQSIMEKYKGIQIEYALCIRQVQCIVYHNYENTKRYNVRNVQEMCDELTFMYENGLTTKDNFQNYVHSQEQLHIEKRKELEEAKKENEKIKKQLADLKRYNEICDKLPNLTDEEQKEFIRTQYSKNYSFSLLSQKVENMQKKINELQEEEKGLYIKKETAQRMSEQYQRNMKDDFTKFVEEINQEKQDKQQTEEYQEEQQNNYYEHNQENASR